MCMFLYVCQKDGKIVPLSIWSFYQKISDENPEKS